ncbi:hypothetical protein [Caulobacter segnis]|uniref:HEPN AbiU2-like domain-containing protein n=1 Tax=Caulobacter segnis TaxID=88688 RepID=A0A2W5WD07_9CAUL|nr:hypothetical protein [Caulobacter segnis]PZR31478.1 MAG: hypothetical protein DI526_19550 [Caulobacter segnis]
MSPAEKLHLRLVYSLRDLELANSALAFLDELDVTARCSKIELRRYRCFLESAVIAYWRPFAAADGLPALGFEALGVVPTAEQQALHERLRIFRNKVVAHSDPKQMRVLLTAHKAHVDHDAQMPFLVIDEGLEFLDDRALWRGWVSILIGALADYVFETVQGTNSYRFERDYLNQGQ